ncbi:MAG: dihydroneopterin aldolase [Balneolaceae bacterium]
MDTLTLKSLQLDGFHGVQPEERERGNRFEIDIIMRGDFKKAASGDDLQLTVNYEWVEEIVLQVMHGPSRQLIETLCHNIGEILFREAARIEHLEVALRKLNPPLSTPGAWAEIRMEWQR